MPKIKTESLKEGMVVAADVKNLDDMLLLPARTQLTEKHIKILLTWGVPEVHVEADGQGDDASDPLAKIPAELLAKVTTEVKQLFRALDETSPVQQEVLRLVIRRRVRQMLGPKHGPSH